MIKLMKYIIIYLLIFLSTSFLFSQKEVIDLPWDSVYAKSYPEAVKILWLVNSFNDSSTKKIPTWVFKLSNMEELHLEGYPFESLEGLHKLRNLTFLSISQTHITSLPDSLPLNLKTLFIRWNPLECDLENLAQLKKLNFLSLAYTNTKNLPPNLPISILNLDGNNIRHIPYSISSYFNLKDLNISSNFIQRLPRFLKKCSFLESIWIEHNQLKRLPSWIKGTNLKYLFFKDNKIKWINGISLYHHVEFIDLSYNLITEMPKDIQKAKMCILLNKNPLITAIDTINCDAIFKPLQENKK